MKPILALILLVASGGCAQVAPHARMAYAEPLSTPENVVRTLPAVEPANTVVLPPRQIESTSASGFERAAYSSIQPDVIAPGSIRFPEFENITSDSAWYPSYLTADGQQTNSPLQSNPQWFTVLDRPGGDPQAIVLNDGAPCNEIPIPASSVHHYTLFETFFADERNFYRCGSLAWLGVGLGASAVIANTSLDEDLRRAVSGPQNSQSTDMNWAKEFGTGQYVVPALIGIFFVDYWIDSNGNPGEHPLAGWLQEWSGRSLRGLTVGAVPLLTLQYAIGSSRPGESSAGSRWNPFQDNNGVSGHAFVGAVPFWTAAQLTENVPLQIGLYGLGTLSGISRIHTDSHYFSQVLMGWWIAALSVAAVNQTEWEKNHWYLGPTMIEGAAGLTAMHEW